jgi:hypothetical protein
VVGGLEALAQRYGSPPSDWAEWDLAVSWDGFMAEQQLTEGQSAALRDRLMLDKQIRLAETFATYVSDRLPTAFWGEPVREYRWNVNGLTGEPLKGVWEVARPALAHSQVTVASSRKRSSAATTQDPDSFMPASAPCPSPMAW